jgi:hypothetical protein
LPGRQPQRESARRPVGTITSASDVTDSSNRNSKPRSDSGRSDARVPTYAGVSRRPVARSRRRHRRFERDARQDRAVTTESRRAASAESRRPRGPVRRWIRARPADVIDLFVYVVVLNLAIEYAPSVISESFTLSLLTAALLKITLELVILLKSEILTRLRAADTRRAKLAAAVSLWVIAAGKQARRARTGRPRLRRCCEPRRLHTGHVARRRPARVTGRSTAPPLRHPGYGLNSNEIGDARPPIANARRDHARVEINIVVVGLHKDVSGGSCKWHREADLHFDAAAPDVG